MIPFAVGRTAGAVRSLPDSGLVMRLTRGRAWIAVLGTLLAGIVALNVLSLSVSSSSSRVAQRATALEQSNSVLRAQIAERLSNDRIEAAASRLGLIVPAPGDITYLTAGPGDAGNAAGRLANGFGGTTTLAAAGTPATQPQTSQPTQTSAPVSTTTASPKPSPQPAATSNPAPPSTGTGGSSGSGGGIAAG